MDKKEFIQIIVAIVILTIAEGFYYAIRGNYSALAPAFLFSTLVIFVSVLAKKAMASSLDCYIEHEIWKIKRIIFVSRGLIHGFVNRQKFENPVPTGVIIPLLSTILTSGILKFVPILTYNITELKYRASRRFGPNNQYSRWSDHDNALIASAGIIALYVLAVVALLLPFNLEPLAKLSIFYAVSNLAPFSKLDGVQIFFGSRPIAFIVYIVSALFFLFALFI